MLDLTIDKLLIDYLGYFHRLVDKYNNTYHRSIGKKPIDADYSVLIEKIETIAKSPKFKVGDRVRITKKKNVFSEVHTENWS